jgi:hypothetical protein
MDPTEELKEYMHPLVGKRVRLVYLAPSPPTTPGQFEIVEDRDQVKHDVQGTVVRVIQKRPLSSQYIVLDDPENQPHQIDGFTIKFEVLDEK